MGALKPSCKVPHIRNTSNGAKSAVPKTELSVPDVKRAPCGGHRSNQRRSMARGAPVVASIATQNHLSQLVSALGHKPTCAARNGMPAKCQYRTPERRHEKTTLHRVAALPVAAIPDAIRTLLAVEAPTTNYAPSSE